MSLKELYEQLERLEASHGPVSEKSRILLKIYHELHPREVLTEDSPFLRLMEELESKPLIKNIRRICRDEPLSDVEVAKTLSSYITHALIEMEHRGEGVFSQLDTLEAAETLNKYLSGDLSVTAITEFFKQRFGGECAESD